jgi:RNA polymerase sigma-70 factor (ECF subfamily)
MTDESADLDAILDRALAGDEPAIQALFDRYRDRLRRMVQFRLDRRLQGRVDASDILQEAFLEAWQRFAEYRRNPPAPIFLWLRFLVGERLVTLHRRHLGAHGRDAEREVSLYSGPLPAANSVALAAQLVGHLTSPSDAAVRAERVLRVQEALNDMEAIDREVLALRHFERLSRAETAQALGIAEAAASKRYVRALQRLKELLSHTGRSGEVSA